MARIQNNIMAMNTHRMYTNNNSKVSKSAEKLSSGYRVNRAGDDAAGLAISEKMRAQIRGLNMAAKNSNDAISLVQTAEGALQEVQNMLQRMNELAVQSASDTNVTLDRSALQLEFEQLQDEIDQIAQTTKFNDTILLDGSMGGGKKNGFSVNTSGANATAKTLNTTGKIAADTDIAFAGGNAGTTIDFAVAAGTKEVKAAWDDSGKLTVTVSGEQNDAITADEINAAIAKATVPDGFEIPSENKNIKYVGDTVKFEDDSAAVTHSDKITGYKDATSTAKVGNVEVTATAKNGGEVFNEDVLKFNASNASVKDVVEVDNATGNITITLDKNTDYTAKELNAMIDAAGGNMTLSFDGVIKGSDVTAAATFAAFSNGGGVFVEGSAFIQVGAEEGHTLELSLESMNTEGLGITKVQASIETRENASKAITISRDAINKISTQRATLGAMQNRLEYKVNNLATTVENLQAAESRIRDVDMADEMSNFTKNNILVQASTAMLAQANSLPQNVLQLLG